MRACMRVCMCVCARACVRVSVRVRVRGYVCVCVYERDSERERNKGVHGCCDWWGVSHMTVGFCYFLKFPVSVSCTGGKNVGQNS